MLHLMVPFFSSDNTKEKEARDRFETWARRYLPANGYTLYPGVTSTIVPRVGEESWRRQKGIFVRDTLMEITNKVPPENRTKESVILIDGSGKIKFSSLLDVKSALDDNRFDIVFSKRGADWAIDSSRKVIEKFENYLIGERYHCVFEDGQCGCWGFPGDIIKKLSLSANSYEIELDLLISSRERHLTTGFVNVEIDKKLIRRGLITQFIPDQHIRKLSFLADKLGFAKETVCALMAKFQKTHKMELPKSYINEVYKRLKIIHRKTKFLVVQKDMPLMYER